MNQKITIPNLLAWLLITASVVGVTTTWAQPAGYGKPEVKYAWTRTMWDFPGAAEEKAYIDNKIYTKAPLFGVKLDKNDNVYVTVARILDGRVPASLNRLVTKNGVPTLQAFPSWSANKLGDPQALQSVLGFDIDRKNRMWALDMGFAGGVDVTPDGAQKIVVTNLTTGKEIKRFVITDDLANRKTSFLNDIAVDDQRDIAYISDSGNRAGPKVASGIVVYDLKTNTAHRVLDRHETTASDATRPLKVNGEEVFPGNPLQVGINGITLSEGGKVLHWSITTGDAVYSIETRYLRDKTLTDAEIAKHIVGPLRIGGGSDGLSADKANNIYITNITTNAVQMLNSKTRNLETIAQSSDLIWPDTLSWDSKGGLWVSSNHLNHAFAGKMDFDKNAPNFRLIRIQTPTGK